MNEPQPVRRRVPAGSDAIFVIATCVGAAVLLVAVGAFVRLVIGASVLP